MKPKVLDIDKSIPLTPDERAAQYEEMLAPSKRLEYELGVIQEKLVADAFEAGHDATEWPLYAVIVALRKFAARDGS